MAAFVLKGVFRVKKLRVVYQTGSRIPQKKSGRLRLCVVKIKQLETGEQIRRGCGFRGMVDCGVGWHCLYCGNIVYLPESSLGSLWFHFKTGREYWTATHQYAQDYVNGIPVDSPVDIIPRSLLADLDEPLPPDWFFCYVVYDEDQFMKYLETRVNARYRIAST